MPVAPPDSSKSLLPFALGDAGGPTEHNQRLHSQSYEKAFEQMAQSCDAFAQACLATNRKGTGVIFQEFVQIFQTLAKDPDLVKPTLKSCAKLLDEATATLLQPK